MDERRSVNDKDWYVIVKTRNGNVSILNNLDLHSAVQARNKADPPMSDGMHYCNDYDVISASIIGPPEWEGCPKAMRHDWPEFTIRTCDGGPNKYKQYQEKICLLCGKYVFEWISKDAV